MSRQVRCCTESAISTWQRVAAKPLRETCSTRSATGSGAIASTAPWRTSTGTPAPTQGAEQHVAARARRGVDPDGHARARVAGPRVARHPGREHARAVAVVDVDHGDAGRAGVEHAEQGGDAAERGAVPDARGDRHERDAGQAADHGRQGALHAGDDDQAVGDGEPVADREQPVQAGHAHVVDPVDRGAVHAHGQRGLGRDGGVGGAGADDRDRAARLRERPERHRAGDEVGGGVGQRARHHVEGLGVEAGGQHGAVGVPLVQGAQDRDHLVGRLAGAVDDLGIAGPRGAVEVDAGEAEVAHTGVGLVHAENLPGATRATRPGPLRPSAARCWLKATDRRPTQRGSDRCRSSSPMPRGRPTGSR